MQLDLLKDNYLKNSKITTEFLILTKLIEILTKF